ncbi:winged helix-turn-helix protein [Roseinatronobacter bogoriensis subsp. barguzinensis]|nr:winged helix-turn-helix protein [Rhodobaca barguzinensis]TDY66196.1 winged helix-turn-helix protein [Rhodobaca bogoriensis DSM 18756]
MESLCPIGRSLKSVLCKTQRITLYELRDALAMAEGVQVHHSSIAALLKRLGFSYKKIAGGL